MHSHSWFYHYRKRDKHTGATVHAFEISLHTYVGRFLLKATNINCAKHGPTHTWDAYLSPLCHGQTYTTVNFPATWHHCLLPGIKLYCLVRGRYMRTTANARHHVKQKKARSRTHMIMSDVLTITTPQVFHKVRST